jgi:sterol desaturase/sphingolipid hydroxylase (fatty acid hydroxylase superfamily)
MSMEQWLIEYETVIRGYAFYGMLSLIALWESLKPAKPSTTSTLMRWINNFALLIMENVFMRWIFPLFAVMLSVYLMERGLGLFNQFAVPLWLSFLITIVLLDAKAYIVHRLLHTVPLLWRLHKIHHTDLDYDVTTGLRFHPLESLVTMGSSLLVIAVLGAPPLAVIAYEILFIVTALFNHGNIHLPHRLDELLRLGLVTPDMHRIHHSAEPCETDSNYSGVFSVWDRAFGTYTRDPAAGQDGMVMGLAEYRDARLLNLYRLLIMPFVNTPRQETAVTPHEPEATEPTSS